MNGGRRPARRGNATAAPPLAAWLIGGAATLFLLAPLAGLAWRAPWSSVLDELRQPDVGRALGLSLLCSVAATGLSTVLGLPLAWVLARGQFRGRNLLRALTMLPLVLPPVVAGVALLLAFGRRGLLGQWLDQWFGIHLPFSTAGAVLAATFVAMPFFVLSAEAGFRAIDLRLEEAARTLGARPWARFLRVTLPLVGPSLAAGAALSWARAVGEFGATITFAGNFPGRTQTTPLQVFLLLQSRPEAAIVLSLVLLAVSLAVLVAMRSRWLGAGVGPGRPDGPGGRR